MKQHFSQVSLFNTKMSAALQPVPSISGNGDRWNQHEGGFTSRGGARNRSSKEQCQSGKLPKVPSDSSNAMAQQQKRMIRVGSEGKLGGDSDPELLMAMPLAMRLDEEMQSLVLQVGVGRWLMMRFCMHDDMHAMVLV